MLTRITTLALSTLLACSSPEAMQTSSDENSDQSGIVINLNTDSPTATHLTFCEEADGCDVLIGVSPLTQIPAEALGLEFIELAMIDSAGLTTTESVVVDDNLIAASQPMEGATFGLFGVPPGQLAVNLTMGDAFDHLGLAAIVFTMPTTGPLLGSIGEPCFNEGESCSSGGTCRDGSCTVACFSDLQCPTSCGAAGFCETEGLCGSGFSCDGLCVFDVGFCDGVNDCQDGQDEAFCACPAGQFSCLDQQTCLDTARVCDDNPDCPHADDESDC